MALRERAALAILAGQADAIAVVDQRGEGQSLGGRPVDALAGVDRLAAIVEEALDRLVEVEALRNLAQLLAIFAQRARLDGGLAAARILLVGGGDGFQARPAAVEPVRLVRLVGRAGFIFGVEAGAPVGPHLVDFALGDQALRDQLLGIELERGLVRADLLVHQRLGERRLVALVVAEAAVAPHVDDDRLLELLPEFGRDLGRRTRPLPGRRRCSAGSGPRPSSPHRRDRARSANSADRW